MSFHINNIKWVKVVGKFNKFTVNISPPQGLEGDEVRIHGQIEALIICGFRETSQIAL
jgi:hypothetical protein